MGQDDVNQRVGNGDKQHHDQASSGLSFGILVISSSYPPISSSTYLPGWGQERPPQHDRTQQTTPHTTRTTASTTSSHSSTALAEQPTTLQEAQHHTASNHSILAAIAIPVAVVILAIAGLAFYLFRRKRRQHQRSPQGPREMRTTSNTSLTRDYRPTPNLNSVNLPAGPIILSERNNAYLTGLDTSSQGSIRRDSREDDIADYQPVLSHRRSLGGTFAEPPPPYKPNDGESITSRRPEDGGMGRARSPFEDPEYDISVADGLMHHRSPFEDPESPVSEVGTARGTRRRMSDVSDL